MFIVCPPKQNGNMPAVLGQLQSTVLEMMNRTSASMAGTGRTPEEQLIK